MTSWMTTGELAETFDTGPDLIRGRLRKLGLLADGPAPTELAVRHDLATVEGDYSVSQALWHPDVVKLLKGTGLIERPEPAPAALFDLPEPGALARSIAAERAGLTNWSSGDDVPGLDRPGADHTDQAPTSTDATKSTSSTGSTGSGRTEESGSRPYVAGADSYGFSQVIATDGACSGNPGPGGWAWVDELTGQRASGGASATTNNIMELTAMLKAIEYADDDTDLLIRSDSQYVINVVTKWAQGWRRRGWKKADGKPVKNRELIEQLLHAYEARTARTRIDWVRGHDGDAGNEEADRLAVSERDRH
ncbi:MAG: ribonuclease H [Flaviflexus sp.]|nr:ribonuclease H [Flaviflexus sp.]